MKEFDPEQIEAELRTLTPAKPPQELLNRVLAGLSEAPKARAAHRLPELAGWSWRGLLRWVVPVTAAAAVCAVFVLVHRAESPKQQPNPQLVSSARFPLKADKVEIDRQLLADFDAVGSLPDGEPVRFRCRQWMDKVCLRDSRSGLIIERSAPHLEIVPVSFEAY